MKKINKESIVQSVFLIVSAILLVYGLIDGRINKYVHPRFNIGIWISIFVLILFAVSILSDNKKGKHNINLTQYILYFIPILCAIAFPPMTKGNANIVLADSKWNEYSSINSVTKKNHDNGQTNHSSENNQVIQEDESEESNIVEAPSDGEQYSSVDDYLQKTQKSQDELDGNNKFDINYGQDIYIEQDINNEQDINIEQDTNDKQDTQDNKEKKVKKKSNVVTEAYHTKKSNDSFIIEDDIFANWYLDLYNHLDNFVGERYQFLAQVYSMEGLKENQFLAGRNFMICCAADLMQYGIICETDNRSELKDKQWIIITATISKYNYVGSEVPILKDVRIKKVKVPKIEYIYYNGY